MSKHSRKHPIISPVLLIVVKLLYPEVNFFVVRSKNFFTYAEPTFPNHDLCHFLFYYLYPNFEAKRVMSAYIGKRIEDVVLPAVVWDDKTNEYRIDKSFSIDKYRGDNYLVLFFYPKDFTFVCPTEILEFEKYRDEFEKLGCKIIGASTDTAEVHWAWLHTPVEKGGIQGVKYPLIADENKVLSINLDILGGDYEVSDERGVIATGPMIAYRATFILDREGKIRHVTINDFPVGRSVKETLRTLKAIQFVDKHGDLVCPAEWEEGKEALKPTFEGVAEYLSKHAA